MSEHDASYEESKPTPPTPLAPAAEAREASRSVDASLRARAGARAGASLGAVVLFVSVTAAVLAADLVVKYASFAHVAGRPVVDVAAAAEDPNFWRDRYPHQGVEVIPQVLSLKLTTNTGAVFGWAAGNQWLFILVSLVACVLIAYVFWRSSARAWLLHLGLALILAGALGNMYDRVRYSAVRDMLWLFPESGLWPWIFNVADAALMVGVFTVIALTWWRELRQRSAESAPG